MKNKPTHAWIFDHNRRVYKDPETGVKSFGPIYKYHWVKHEIIGETRVSWLYGDKQRPCKIPKKGERYRVYFSLEEVEQDCYVKENVIRLAEMFRHATYNQLKEIERILSPQPK